MKAFPGCSASCIKASLAARCHWLRNASGLRSLRELRGFRGLRSLSLAALQISSALQTWDENKEIWDGG